MENYGTVKLKLKKYMDNNNKSRTNLAKVTNLRYEVINRYYSNEVVDRLSSDVLAKICCALKCDLSDILEYVEN